MVAEVEGFADRPGAEPGRCFQTGAALPPLRHVPNHAQRQGVIRLQPVQFDRHGSPYLLTRELAAQETINAAPAAAAVTLPPPVVTPPGPLPVPVQPPAVPPPLPAVPPPPPM